MNLKTIEKRSRITKLIREYLEANEFIEIFSPKLLDFLTDPVRGNNNEGISAELNKQKKFLAQSNQNFKQQAIISGMKKVYEISHYWRANREGITERHNYEFLCLDVEERDITSEHQLMDLLSDLIANIIKKEKNLCNISEIKTPIPKVTYDEAISKLKEAKIKIEWGEDIGHIREKELGKILKSSIGSLFFIYKYPAVVKKFYTEKYEENSDYTKTFDLIFNGWEICSGAVRERRREKITEGLNELKLNNKLYEFYTNLFDENTPRHGGFGFGIDRFIAILCGYNRISEFDDALWKNESS